VIIYGGDGARLLTRPDEYDITGDTIIISESLSGYTHYKVLYSTKLCSEEQWHDGRWEWVIIGENSHASDSLESSIVSSAWMDWKNKKMWLTGPDVKSADMGPAIPWVMRSFRDEDVKEGYYFDPASDDFRSAFRDDWDKDTEIYPYSISSSDIIVIGGPKANQRADYFNDFTDAKDVHRVRQRVLFTGVMGKDDTGPLSGQNTGRRKGRRAMVQQPNSG
jgi:hypothetical protein